MRDSKPVVRKWLTFIKYLFSMILIWWTFSKIGNRKYLIAEIIELFAIFAFSNILFHTGHFKQQILNCILMLLYNSQIIVLAFGNTYISMLMLTNLTSVEALIGKANVYIGGMLIIIIFSFIPICEINISKRHRYGIVISSVAFELLFFSIYGIEYSPFGGYISLIHQYNETQLFLGKVEDNVSDSQKISDALKNGYKEEVESFIEKDINLPEYPNIILIFTEGLSQIIINDEREIMPNVAKYQKNGISFDNYYNHTFATYRGLIGQLFSGYQLNNNDSNGLVSLQSILQEEGYNTFWINTEPYNDEFTTYLNSFDFDRMVNKKEDVDDYTQTIADKRAYEILFDLALKQKESEKPFFIGIYTFGTHASLESPDEVFGDGLDAEINKFYNVDYQFGLFMEKLENSLLKDDTIIIFTTDHATYQDDSFDISFPNAERSFITIDEIPLFIYYEGIEPQSIDVKGRNTLNLAPTILDYLDISASNYFMGTSLFSGCVGSICETTYQETITTLSTADGIIRELSEIELTDFQLMLERYYILKAVISGS